MELHGHVIYWLWYEQCINILKHTNSVFLYFVPIVIYLTLSGTRNFKFDQSMFMTCYPLFFEINSCIIAERPRYLRSSSHVHLVYAFSPKGKNSCVDLYKYTKLTIQWILITIEFMFPFLETPCIKWRGFFGVITAWYFAVGGENLRYILSACQI